MNIFIKFLLTLLCVSAKNINIENDNTLLLIEYNKYNNLDSIAIDNIKYRETSSYHKSYFPLILNRGEYNISSTDLRLNAK